jgi:dihydropteroate synthase
MLRRKRYRLKLPTKRLELGQRTLVMGVLNVTPDSFSDGGAFLDTGRAVEHALEMERAGADMVDIGGESTRPGSE